MEPSYHTNGARPKSLKSRKLTMRKILILLVIISFISCKQNENSVDNSIKSSDIIKKTEVVKITNTNVSLLFDKTVINTVKEYYMKEYIKEIKKNEMVFEEEATDSSYVLNYIPIEEGEREIMGMRCIIIPKITSFDKSAVFGDLNNDNLEDLVLTVKSEGPGTLNSSNFFVFLNQNNKLDLKGVTSDYEILTSTNAKEFENRGKGYFAIKEINNGFLIGITSLYKDDSEPNCCPSLNFVTKTKLSGKKLIFYSF